MVRLRSLPAAMAVAIAVTIVAACTVAGEAPGRRGSVGVGAALGIRASGGAIVGPDGDPFVPVGVNLLGPDAFFYADGVTAGHARVLAGAWNLNTLRPGRPADRRWLDVNRRLLDAIGGAGATNLVVIDGTGWGQEAGGDGVEPVRSEDSAILTFGDELAGSDDAVVFSFHVYDQWAATGSGDGTRDARIIDFVTRVRDAGDTEPIGETGSPAGECCDGRSLATQAANRVADRLGIGLLAWHGQGVDGYQLVEGGGNDRGGAPPSPSAIDDGADPQNLTWHGRLLWDLAHRR